MSVFSTFIRVSPRSSRFTTRHLESFKQRPTTYRQFQITQRRTFSFFNRGNRIEKLKRWVQRPSFYYEVAGLSGVGGAFYVANLETVPVSGRKRFNIVSPEWERDLGKQQYDALIDEFKGKILPHSSPEVIQVKRVLGRLVDGLEKLEDSSDVPLGNKQRVLRTTNSSVDDWEVNVIKSDIANAFVIPGNKVFVFSGILPICQDDAGIATVLGHEISHNLAHHAAEQLSSSVIRWLVVIGLAFFGYLDYSGLLFLDLAFTKPRSRRQESEADMVGLNLMALSCYDPRSAIPFWKRMEAAEKVSVPEFISTHPSGDTRIKQFAGWMDDAIMKYNNAGCSRTRRMLINFDAASDWRGS